jgi:hypothetical protein
MAVGCDSLALQLGRLVPIAAVIFLATAAAAAAQQASEAQRNAIRQACPADYQTYCANVPPGGKPAFDCLAHNLGRLSPPCQRVVGAVVHGAAHTAPHASTAAPAAAAMAAPTAPPIPLREQLMILRQSCSGDFRALCSGVPLGGGRAIACLRANAGALSPQCGAALRAR